MQLHDEYVDFVGLLHVTVMSATAVGFERQVSQHVRHNRFGAALAMPSAVLGSTWGRLFRQGFAETRRLLHAGALGLNSGLLMQGRSRRFWMTLPLAQASIVQRKTVRAALHGSEAQRATLSACVPALSWTTPPFLLH